MRSQRKARANSVVNGIAVLDACAHVKRLRKKISEKRRPGKRRAVCIRC